jgi:hypothetical protein
MTLSLVLIAMGIGVVAEIIARILRLWLFRHWSLAILNIVVVYGFVMGGVAVVARPLGSSAAFLLAAAIGFAYELANLQFLHFWRFPDERVSSANARLAVIVVISLFWGCVPLVALQAQAALRRSAFVGANLSPLEQLNEREHLLIDKLADLQQRTRDVEAKLEAVRQRKERLLRRREVSGPGTTPRATPSTAHEEMK